MATKPPTSHPSSAYEAMEVNSCVRTLSVPFARPENSRNMTLARGLDHDSCIVSRRELGNHSCWSIQIIVLPKVKH